MPATMQESQRLETIRLENENERHADSASCEYALLYARRTDGVNRVSHPTYTSQMRTGMFLPQTPTRRRKDHRACRTDGFSRVSHPTRTSEMYAGLFLSHQSARPVIIQICCCIRAPKDANEQRVQVHASRMIGTTCKPRKAASYWSCRRVGSPQSAPVPSTTFGSPQWNATSASLD